MGSRGSANITRGGKPKKKSKFSALHQLERARVGASTRRQFRAMRNRVGVREQTIAGRNYSSSARNQLRTVAERWKEPGPKKEGSGTRSGRYRRANRFG